MDENPLMFQERLIGPCPFGWNILFYRLNDVFTFLAKEKAHLNPQPLGKGTNTLKLKKKLANSTLTLLWPI